MGGRNGVNRAVGIWRRLFAAIAVLSLLVGCGSSANNADLSAASTELDSTSKSPRSDSQAADSVFSSASSKGAGDDGANSTAAEEGPPPETYTPAVTPRFVEIAKASGVDFTFYSDTVPGRFFLPEVMGGGVAWWDFDGDGLLDLFFQNGCALKPETSPKPDPNSPRHTSRLFRQIEGGKFVDVTGASQCWHDYYGQGCAVGDYDADGFLDIYLANFGDDVLLHNQGDGQFIPATPGAAVSDDLWSSSAVWLDADEDGDLDLYVVNYMDLSFANHRVCSYQNSPGYCGPGAYQGVTDRVYLNLGDGRFEAGGASIGLEADGGKGLAISVVDLDGDRRPEVYVANDMDANFLFTRSSGDRSLTAAGRSGARWSEIAVRAGCATSGEGANEASMGLAVSDFDLDGYCDLYLTHFYRAKNTLYKNFGELTFADESYSSRSAITSHDSLGFGVVAVDADRDGADDLFVANGHVLGPNVQPFEMTPLFLCNDGQGRFFDCSALSGDYFREKSLGRSVASGDYDNDGDLDIAVSHLNRPVALLANETPAGGVYMGIELCAYDRAPPLGAVVRVIAGDTVRTRPVQSGGSYLAHLDSRLLFGFQEQIPEATVEVDWPDGKTDRWEHVTTGRYWRLYPGQPPIPSPGQSAVEKN